MDERRSSCVDTVFVIKLLTVNVLNVLTNSYGTNSTPLIVDIRSSCVDIESAVNKLLTVTVSNVLISSKGTNRTPLIVEIRSRCVEIEPDINILLTVVVLNVLTN